MAEGKRIYEIKIEGLQESYEGVKSLRETLNTLTDTVVNVKEEEAKTASTRKEAAAGTDALAKATQKLNDWDRSYQTELALVNKELSNNKKEINDAIKLQEAQATVDAKQLDTYAQKQQYLSALNKLIRNHSTATEEDRAAIDRMVQESAALQAELKATDEQMKIYVRNVGNYPGAAKMVVDSHKSIKLQLRELKEEMTSMLANGVSKTDEAYLKLAKRAGQLKDAMVDANKDITNFASDTRGLTNAINLATTAVSTYQLYNSALQVFGGQNQEAAEAMRKMMGIMTMLNSLQQIQNNLLANGSASGRLYTKAVELIKAALGLKKTATEADIATTEASTAANEANAVSQEANAAANEASAVAEGIETAATEANTVATGTNTGALGTNTGALGANATASQGAAAATNSMSVAQKAGAVASKTLSVALRAIPLVAIIGLVMALIQNWESIWNWFKKTFPVLDTLSKKFNKFGGLMNAIVSGAKAVAAAVMNFLINPFKTFANVVGKILEGDFKGAWQAALDGLKNQFKGSVDAFKGEIVKGYARGQEEMTAKAAEESNKRTKQELAELKIQERNNKTYSKKYIELQKKDFEERKKMAKGNQEELNKIKLEEMQFDADIEDKKTKMAEKGAKARAAAAKDAAKDAQKAIDELNKETEALIKNNEKVLAEMRQFVYDSSKLASTNMADTYKRVEEESFKARNEAAKQVENLKILISQSKKNIEEYQTDLKNSREEFAKTGDETYNETIKRNTQLIEHEVANLNLLSAKLEQAQSELAKHQNTIVENTWKRQAVMVEMFAAEATKKQQEFQDKLQGYRDQMFENEEKLTKKISDEQRKQIKKDLEKLEKEYNDVLKEMEEQLGDYFTNEIPIPVKIDFDGILKRLGELPSEIKSMFNTSKIAEYILGIDGTTEDLFDRIVKGAALVEFREQFLSAAEATGTAKDKLEEINAVIDSDLSFDRIRERLHAYREEMKLSEEDFNSLYDAIVQNAVTDKGVVESFKMLGDVVGLSKEEIQKLYDLLLSGLPIEEMKKQVSELFSLGNVQLNKFGTLAYTTNKDAENISKNVGEQIKKTYQDALANANKLLSDADKSIKKFQDATREIKFEPVIEQYQGLFKEFDRGLGITKLNMDKTKERYSELKKAYNDYLSSIQKGSKEMIQYEAAWEAKLENTKALYTEDSIEYRQALDEKEKADQAYVAERIRVSQQIEAIQNGEDELRTKWIENFYNNLDKIIKAIQTNVLNPIFDGLSDLFAFQLEEAQEALEKTTKLYDKAVEARQESADRMKQINDELRADEGQNKEALQQRLAEEEVLLVQREETERALQKEKEKREKEVEKKEAQQRVLELSQKLVEGIANTALGVTAALKYGPILGPVFAAIIGAMGALQTAIIAKQISKARSKMEYGGKVGEDGVSRSHKQGGHRIEDTNIEVEGGEWVINKKSSQKYDSLLRSINDDKVGLVQKQVEIIREKRVINNNQPVRFADGGQINTLAATRAVRDNNDITAITDLIKQIDFEPTVSVVDINRKNKNLVRVQQYAGKAG